jgi:hypothetical protein
MHRRSLVLLLAFTLIFPALTVIPAAGQADPASRALAHAANVLNAPQDTLEVVEETTASFPISGRVLSEYKFMTEDGQTLVVSLDADSGEIVDAEDVARDEQQRRIDDAGVSSPTLFSSLNSQAADRIPVAIWVAVDGLGTQGRGASPDYDAVADSIRAAQAPVADAARGIGAEISLADLVPVIFAELTAGQIKGLANHPKVLAIDPITQDLQRHTDDSATSDRFTFIWNKANGAGAKVAVHEDDGVTDQNTFLNAPVYWCTAVNTGPGGTNCNVGKNIDQHATNVAGVIASTHEFRRGGAWGITEGSLLSANFQSFSAPLKIVNSASWAIAEGADTINMSWGGCSNGDQDFYSRWVDYLVKTFGVSIVVSSGNRQCPTGWDIDFVSIPSLGWNTISVGSYFDSDTGLRSDDVLSSFSGFRNPVDPNTGRTYEKPDVVGMGGQVDSFGCYGVETTDMYGGVEDSTCGTSFSAPDVSALTALVVGKDTDLRRKAEAIKAVIMAGATHNIVGGSGYRQCGASPIPNDCQDGAGGIDAYQTIESVVIPGNWRYEENVTPASFNAAGFKVYPVTIEANQSIRVALAWDSTAVCTNVGSSGQDCSSDTLNADLDLMLVNPAGKVVASSMTLQNSAEVLDYLTPVGGTYKIRIRSTRFDAGTNTNFGLAWNLDTMLNRNALTGVMPIELNSTLKFQGTTKGRSHWDSYSGDASCDFVYDWMTGLEKVYRVKTTQTGTITASLTNLRPYGDVGGDADVIIVKKGGPANLLNTKVAACGDWLDKKAVATDQPPGIYIIIVDGSFDSVAKFNLTVNFTPTP